MTIRLFSLLVALTFGAFTYAETYEEPN
ncbi:MAG: hypothetical protein RL636_1811, partial [Verrucomicrobiota bacterium]